MEKRNNKKKRAAKWTLAAAILMVVSMIGASWVQTSGGRVQVKDLQWETSKGYKMSGLLLKPKTADEKNKAPAVIACHGMYNNREMQDMNYVELSRRGYVVLSIDMFSHGKSENLKSEDLLPMSVSEALKLLGGLDYVDTGRIGLTGHSMGGMNCEVAAQMDNGEEPLVSAILFNSCFATYQNPENGDYINAYGSRDVGIIAGQYDEFLFREVNRDGTKLLPKDFINSDNAQSFLNFGTAPEKGEKRKSNTIYHQTIDGEQASRVVYNPAVTHPWAHFSKRTAADTIEFFGDALGAPKEIEASNQVWQFKEFFNLLGLIGLGMFALNFALLLIYTPLFEKLRSGETALPRETAPKERVLNLSLLAANVLFGAMTYLPIVVGVKSSDNGKVFFAQNSTFGIGLWAAACGGFAILTLAVNYVVRRKLSISEPLGTGIKPGLPKLARTVLLALTVVFAAYLWVFAADYFFQTDFRIWVLAAKAFDRNKLITALFPNLLLFLVYYGAISVSSNCFYHTGPAGKRKLWRNTFVQAAAAVLPVLLIVAVQYICLFATGDVYFSQNNTHSYILWLFPMLVMIPASVIIGRKLYRETENPYLPAIINACLVTLITCANTTTWS